MKKNKKILFAVGIVCFSIILVTLSGLPNFVEAIIAPVGPEECHNDSECKPNEYCSALTKCQPKKATGEECDQDRHCLTNYCGVGQGGKKYCIEPKTGEGAVKWAPIAPTLQINIPTLQPFTTKGMEQPDAEGYVYIPFIGQYIAGIYTWAVGIAGLIAVVLIITGGFMYLTSAGNAQRTQDAKDRISSALFGLLLLLASYVLLYTINPDLVKFKSLRIKIIERHEFEGKPGGGFAAGNPVMAEYDAASCPTSNEKNLKLFTTGYYKPPYGEKGPYTSFECNIAMQCLCPGDKYENGKLKLEGREAEASCSYKGMSWRPCKKFEENTRYCTQTTKGTEPTANHTIAASKCFKMGCNIMIGAIPYTVEDTGSAIKGRHIDVFMGGDLKAAQEMTGVKDAVLGDNCF